MGGKGKKLYVYVDESGQHTEGRAFVVGVIVTDEERERLRNELEAVEAASKKRIKKWNETRKNLRVAYIEGVRNLQLLKRCVYVRTVFGSRDYEHETALSTAHAILDFDSAETRASIFVDGLKRANVASFSATLRAHGLHIIKVRGVRRDENEPLIRLADAICGLKLDALQGQAWARALYLTLQHALSLP